MKGKSVLLCFVYGVVIGMMKMFPYSGWIFVLFVCSITTPVATAQYQQVNQFQNSKRRYDFLGGELLDYLNKRERANVTGDWGLDGIRSQLDGMSSDDVKSLIKKWFMHDGMSLADAKDCAEKLVSLKPVDWQSKLTTNR